MPIVKSLVRNKREAYLTDKARAYAAPVPVVIVGNISVGGTGKSPMVVALCDMLKEQGMRPGIVSRGHGVTLTEPLLVQGSSQAKVVGDEPAMLARRTQCPTVVFAKRALAIQHLLDVANVDVVICDDGMQHYAIQRDIEIAMVDAQRGVGNGQLLPVGPLREPVERLTSVDFVVSISEQMTQALDALPTSVITTSLSSPHLVSLDGKRTLSFDEAFSGQLDWHVMAGIGNPERFLVTLEKLGLSKPASIHWFTDHHAYSDGDIPQTGAVLMTEKDAVKCQALSLDNSNIWYLPVTLLLPEAFTSAFLNKLQTIKDEKHHE